MLVGWPISLPVPTTVPDAASARLTRPGGEASASSQPWTESVRQKKNVRPKNTKEVSVCVC